MTLSNGAVHDTIRHILIEHDRTEHDRAKTRKSYHNPYALGLYMETLQSVMKFIDAGKDTREVLIGHFNGRILAKCLKALRLSPATFEEENRNLVRRTYY